MVVPRDGEVAEAGLPGGGGLAGRQHERSRLRSALEDLLEGRGRLVLLAGEPGIGKTRLAEELAEEARKRGANVAWGRRWVEPGAPDLWPWLQVIRVCLRAVDEDTLRELVGPHGSELTTLVAPLRPRASEEPSAPAAPGRRFRLFNAIAHFLDEYARRAPLVVILDDLHEADATSLLLLQFFTHELRERRILLIGTYRDPSAAGNRALTQTVLEAMREPGTERLELCGLGEAETGTLLRIRLAAEPPAALVTNLHRWTGGNPLFLTECARQLERHEGGPGRLPTSAGELRIPELLREVIEQRLAPLSAGERAVLRAAARGAREFTLAELATLASPDATRGNDGVAAALAAAERLGLVVHAPRAGAYRFAQDIVRAVLVEEAPTTSGDREAPAAAAADAVAAPPPAAPTGGAVFRKEGEYWTLGFGGRTGRMRDVKGLAYVAVLLRHPREQLHVSELVSLGGGAAETASSTAGSDPSTPVRRGLGDAGEVLDAQAKAEYRRRLAELEAELAEADSFHDIGRAERARREIELLSHELSAAVGLGGRDRRAGSDVERARVNVTRSIARALEKMAECHPELAQHLGRCIRTGTFCTYVPDVPAANEWVL